MTTKLIDKMLSSPILKSLSSLSLVAGDMIFATGAGAFSRFAKGGAGQYLRRKTDDSGYEWTDPPASNWTLLANDTISAVAGWSKTDLSAYRALRLRGFFRPASDAQSLLLFTSTNNGSTFDTGASDYVVQFNIKDNTTMTASRSTSSSILISGASVGNASAAGIHFDISMELFNKAKNMRLLSRVVLTDSSGNMKGCDIEAMRLQQTERDAIFLKFGSGNIAEGYVTLEGLVG